MLDQTVTTLAATLELGGALALLRESYGGYELLDHWQQGEFHHDVVLKVNATLLPAPYLIIATNCNGGIKEVLFFDQLPDRSSLWHWRCPESAEFVGSLIPIRARTTTIHWFDPCELLSESARSELLPEYRERQQGGGWQMKSSGGCGVSKNNNPRSLATSQGGDNWFFLRRYLQNNWIAHE